MAMDVRTLCSFSVPGPAGTYAARLVVDNDNAYRLKWQKLR